VCDIVLNVHAQPEGTIDYMKDGFYKELYRDSRVG
jgi:hypothetical protein